MPGRIRFDVVLFLGAVALLLLLLTGTSNPKPAAAPAPPAAVATSTPAPTATAGWAAQITPGPLAAQGLPALPTVSLENAAGGVGAGPAQPVAFTVLSCPQSTVKISRIMTGQRQVWNVYGAATIPNLAYWKAELSADGQNWTLLYRSAAPVNGAGLLIEFNTSTVPAGAYQLRLLAVDRTGNYGEPCTVAITTA